jgi:hypothetical protein
MESRTKTPQETLLVNGLAEVTNDPIVQGARPDVVIGVGGNEDRRNRAPDIDEASVEFESGHRGHMNVSDQAGGFAKASGSEEIRSRWESLDNVAQ